MKMVMVIWYMFGLISLFAGTKDKPSFLVEGLKCFTEQKSGADVFEGVMYVLIVFPLIIISGPLTLVRFKKW